MTAILLALVFIVLLLVIVVTGQPDEFVVSRRIKITAPAGQVFPHVNEVRNWEAWNPWSKADPDCKMTYDGPSAGVGASYSWNGKKVGAGHNTITQSTPDQYVRFRLEFLKPMTATNTVEFTFQSDSSQTVVTWTMSGVNSPGSKLFGMLVNFEKMCGNQFEKGLADMKSVVETGR